MTTSTTRLLTAVLGLGMAAATACAPAGVPCVGADDCPETQTCSADSVCVDAAGADGGIATDGGLDPTDGGTDGGADGGPADCMADEYFDGATCRAVRECTGGQFESKAPTPTSNRECTEKTRCATTEYESMPATATSDRTCAPLTVCADDEYETMAPTATSDRRCAALTVCADDEYQTVEPTATSDRDCEMVTECVSGEWESAEPTATSDRECTAHSAECNNNTHYESQQASETQDRVCTARTVCEAEQYISDEGNPRTDRTCTPYTVCGEGQYISMTGTATTDRACADLSTCSAQQWESEPATATSDRECTALTTCGPDVDVPSGGTYETTAPTPTRDRACTPWTVCEAGEYELTEPGATQDRICQAFSMTNVVMRVPSRGKLHVSATVEGAESCRVHDGNGFVGSPEDVDTLDAQPFSKEIDLDEGDALDVTLYCTAESTATESEVLQSDVVHVWGGNASWVNLVGTDGPELVTGDVTLDINNALIGSDTQNDDDNLRLREVGGHLLLQNNTTAEFVRQYTFENLAVVRGNVLVTNNTNLRDLPLPALSTVGGGFDVSDNDALTSVSAGALSTVGDAFTVSGNGALTTVDFSALRGAATPAVGGFLTLANNTSLCALQAECIAEGTGVGSPTVSNNSGACYPCYDASTCLVDAGGTMCYASP